MSLSPQRRRERRAYAAALRSQPKIRQMHCHNCNKLTPKNRPNKKFCSEKCKTEYHGYGAAFGPLKAKLEKLIEQTAKEQGKKEAERIKAEILASVEKKLEALRDIIVTTKLSPASYARSENAQSPEPI